VALSGDEILANDVRREARYRYTDALPETHSEVALPLKIEDRVLGVLDVQSDQPDDFHETDMLVLRALAGNIAIAIEAARLYSALRHRAEQLSAVSEDQTRNAWSPLLEMLSNPRILQAFPGLEPMQTFVNLPGGGRIDRPCLTAYTCSYCQPGC
jgi:GAF domain-containing protein